MALLSCLLCETTWKQAGDHQESSSLDSEDPISTTEFIRAHKTFYTFCKYLDVAVPKKTFGWNFLSDPLPFCTSCKDVVGCLIHLDEELERIQEDIHSLVSTFKVKLKDTHRKNASTPDSRVGLVRRLILRLPKESTQIETRQQQDNSPGDSPLNHFDSEDDDEPTCTFDSSTARSVKSPEKHFNNSKDRASCIVQGSSVSDRINDQIITLDESEVNSVFPVANEVTVDIDVESNEIETTSEANAGVSQPKKQPQRKLRQLKSSKSESSEFPPHQPVKRRVVKKLADGKFIFEGVEFSKTESGNFQCSICPNILKTRDSALCHIKQRHLGEGLGKFLCHVCGKSFDRLVYLKTHEILHTNLRPHLCTTCGRAFAQRANLYNHIKIHEGDLKFQCEVCSKKFLTRGQLRLHMQMHLGIRPFECSLCSKSFVRSFDLVLHMRSHNGIRPFECHICHNSSFYTKYKLNRHLTNVHNKEGRKTGTKMRQEKEKETQNEGLQSQPIQILQSEPITFYELI